jgi:glycosyltransferase involved in cell wall biosynthesis
MARIAVVTSSPPHVEGGHLVIARSLIQALNAHGHQANLVVTPSYPFGRQAREYWETWRTNVRTHDGQTVDHVISTRYPSYAVRHPSHVCWLNHTMREYYDLWEQFSARLSAKGRVKERVRQQLIHAADSHFFYWHVKQMYAQSKTIQARLRRWNRTTSTVLYPPAPPRAYRCAAFEPFLFVVSRLAPLKRIDLILNALATPAAQGVRCVIAGEGEQAPSLIAQARRLQLEDRVTFVGRISDEELVDYLGRCRAVAFVPLQEDYGFVTAEAFASGKPVITTTDSGGPAELVADGTNGRVVAPTAAALGEAIAAVMADPADAERLGRAALATAAQMRWSDVAATLGRPL